MTMTNQTTPATNRACPRCGTATVECHHVARDGDETFWRVLHCSRCSFTWRSTEEPEVIDPALRPATFQLDADDMGSW